jgi:heterodisulfide reductase subunit B
MSIGYYPGCSLHATAKEYDMSMRAVCKTININLEEVEDWNCCGATPAHTTSEELGIALPYSNLVNASKQNLSSLVAPCAACYNRLKVADYRVKNSEKVKQSMDYLTAGASENNVKVLNIIEFFRDVYGFEKLKELVKNPLTDLKVACYYGCLLVRPADIIKFDDPEDPTSMDELIQVLGGTTVDWSHKTECCGGSHAIPKTDIVLELCRKILKAAELAGAECIAVACPLCQANLDMRQTQINKQFNTKFNIPVLYITELIGLALGINYTNLGLNSHFTSTSNIKEKCCNNK